MELSDSLCSSLQLSTSYSSTSFADDSNATAPKPPSCMIDYTQQSSNKCQDPLLTDEFQSLTL